MTPREWMRRLRGTLRPQRPDAELREELRLHLELAAERAERSGQAPADARRQAAIRSGGLDQTMEALRDQRGLPWLDNLRRDVHYAWRAVASRPGFAAVAILTLGSGLGLCLTVVTIANAYLGRSMPYPHAERVHWLGLRTHDGARMAGVDQVDWSALDDLVEERIAWDSDAFALLGGAFPETARGGWVNHGFVAGLGLRPALGRLLDERDFEPGGGPTPVLISHRLWTRRFGGDPGVVGRSIRAIVRDRSSEAETLTVVGVLADFWHLNPHRDVFAPLRGPATPVLLRLRPGVDPRSVAERATALVRAGARDVPDGWQASVTGLQDSYVEGVRPLLKAVLFSAVLVLLIACANVAVLLLVRSTRRRHEMAIRLALGASRGRLARLLGLEALLLGGLATLVGCALGVVLARAAAPLVEEHVERRLPGGAAALALDPLLIAAMLAGGVILTSALTLVPLLTLRGTSVTGALKTAGRGSTEGRTARRLRSTLIGAEVAAALALLVGSALLIRTAVKMLGTDPGFRPGGLVTADVALRASAYPHGEARARFYERLVQRLDEPGGPGRSALASGWPLYRADARRVERMGPGRESARPGVTQVTAGYFAALGVPLLDGTSFEAEDRAGGASVAVVSESLARRLWPGGRAVGQELRIAEAETDPDASAGAAHRVVGVVGDVARVDYHDGRVRAPADRLDVYLPLLQDPGPAVHLFARDTGGGPDALRTAIAQLDPEVAVDPPLGLAELLDESRRGPRQLAWVLSSFAAFAALIALVGVYSVCAYSVRQREREIGVRLVVGADPRTVTRLFVREGGLAIAAGLLAGLLAAAALGNVLRSQLFGVEPLAPGVLAATTALFAACGALALWWPASRAARIDPARVLKDE